MKKSVWMVLSILMLVGVVSLAGVSLVHAQTATPPAPGTGTPGLYRETMREYMHAALAEQLGLTKEELETRLSEGQTVYQIAQEKGLSVDEFRTLMINARTTALDRMVADGVITQEQADWMKTRGLGRGGRAGGNGGCPMMGGQWGTSQNPGVFRGGRGMMGGNR
ncbi:MULTISPECIES: hypothetical protein [Anaerolinea]|uniref:hypothetical protein n=1 Tax=Anaerolinea TaxID=233189 RepID=UPI00260894EE|nr:hypothetical protein [Anaerolinea thermophila]